MSPDQAASGRFVGSDLGPNSLQKLSADDTGRLMYVVYQSNWFESQADLSLIQMSGFNRQVKVVLRDTNYVQSSAKRAN